MGMTAQATVTTEATQCASSPVVKSRQKISGLGDLFTATFNEESSTGMSVASIGDVDGDGVLDIAVGDAYNDDGGNSKGAVAIVLLNTDSTVKSRQKISEMQSNFEEILDIYDSSGHAVAGIGNLDGDDVVDIVVGAFNDGDGGFGRGAVWVLFLDVDGTVKGSQKISDEEGIFTGALDDNDFFGLSVAAIGDLNGDGVVDIAVGAPGDDDGNDGSGSIRILFLNNDGLVKSQQKISGQQGGFDAILNENDNLQWQALVT